MRPAIGMPTSGIHDLNVSVTFKDLQRSICCDSKIIIHHREFISEIVISRGQSIFFKIYQFFWKKIKILETFKNFLKIFKKLKFFNFFAKKLKILTKNWKFLSFFHEKIDKIFIFYQFFL